MVIFTPIRKIGEEIYENLQNAYCTPLDFFVENFFDNWYPEIHGPRNYFQSFIWLISLKNAGKKHYPFADIRNGIKKGTRSSYNKTMNNGTSSSSSDYETTPKFKKSYG